MSPYRATSKIQGLILFSQIKGNGGIPRFNRNLINSLNNSADVDYISLNDTKINNGVERNKLKFIIKIIIYTIRFKPSFIIIGHLNFFIFAFLKFFSRKTKFITILHGIEAWYPRKNQKWFYSVVDEFWAVSEYTKYSFSKANKIPLKKIKLIFNTLPQNWTLPSEQIKYNNFLLSVTRLDASEGYKGVDFTIQSIGILQNFFRQENWKYIIVAAGNDLERHKEIVKQNGISDLVQFKSNIRDEELRELYKNCSFFCLPSSGEGFGIVYLEAMAYKKPCVGAKNCGAKDVIENNKTGFLIHPNPENIVNKISFLIKNPEVCKEMGENGFKRLHSKFIFSCFSKRINELICVE